MFQAICTNCKSIFEAGEINYRLYVNKEKPTSELRRKVAWNIIVRIHSDYLDRIAESDLGNLDNFTCSTKSFIKNQFIKILSIIG